MMRFSEILAEGLHIPLLNLHGALLALNHNSVEPLLKPTPSVGRAPESEPRQALIGFAVGTVGRLRWTGLSNPAAYKAVADTLQKMGVNPSRGSGRVTGRTVRNWCETVSADVGGRTIAAMNANLMLSPKWQAVIKAQPPEKARKFTLGSLTVAVRKLSSNATAEKNPSKPPV
jgi:hypothetical protein